MLYEPTYEEEAVILFSLLIPCLQDNFVIDYYSGAFPDCFAKRNGKDVGIEFELQASNFSSHERDPHADLSKCGLIVCWENDAPYRTIKKDGREFLIVEKQGRKWEIEIMALSKEVERAKPQKFVLRGKRCDIGKANKEGFFEQIRTRKRYEWIRQLYEWVMKKEEFDVRWGRGERWFTMRFYVKRWNIDPISVQGNGMVTVAYQGNPYNSPWELPQCTQTALRSIFGHREKQKWPSVSLDTKEDFDKLKEALETFAGDSTLNVIWHRR